MPRVSVIIPAFNAERHIEETLHSVHRQTYEDWEVVLADDCSTDETAEIAGRFGPRVKIVQTRENSGPATARNVAIAEAGGQLLAFLDADDYWLPDYLERQVSLYDTSSGADRRVGIVAANARVLGQDGFLPGTYCDYVGFPREVTVAQLLRSNPILVSALTPRDVVDEAGGFCPEMRRAEDHDLWIRIVELGYRVVATPDPLVVYRLSSDSLSASTSSMARAVQIVYTRALERGNLTAAEQRVARRELRRQRAVEVIAEPVNGWRVLKTLPLLLVVAFEHPSRWSSGAKMLLRRGHRFSPFPV